MALLKCHMVPEFNLKKKKNRTVKYKSANYDTKLNRTMALHSAPFLNWVKQHDLKNLHTLIASA